MHRDDVVFGGKNEEGLVVGVVAQNVDWWLERIVFLVSWWFTGSGSGSRHLWDLGREDERFSRSLMRGGIK